MSMTSYALIKEIFCSAAQVIICTCNYQKVQFTSIIPLSLAKAIGY